MITWILCRGLLDISPYYRSCSLHSETEHQDVSSELTTFYFLVPNSWVNFYSLWSHLETELCQASIASVPSRNSAIFAGRCSLLMLPTLYFPEPSLLKPHDRALETVGWIVNCLALQCPAHALKIVLHIQHNLNNNSSSPCFVEHKKFILKFIQKCEGLIIAKNAFQKNRCRVLVLPEYRAYY